MKQKVKLAALLALATTITVMALQAMEDRPAQALDKSLPLAVGPARSSPAPDADALPIRPVPADAPVNEGKARLGKLLFNERRLSRNQDMSCASCHDLSRGGADGKKLATLFDGALSPVNTPSVFNVSLFPYLYWDGAARSLEAQVAVDLQKHMGADWDTIIPLLNADPAYAAEFNRLYQNGASQPAICNAIAEFERTLLTPNARFDRYLKGEEQVITLHEKKGYQLFVKYGCINCHQGAGVGGNMFERLGVVYPVSTNPTFKSPAYPHADEGRFKVTGKEKHRYYFRAPSLRNVEKTAPYFHDGSITSLEDAIRIMGYYNLGVSLPEKDVLLIATFLKTLSGEPQPLP